MNPRRLRLWLAIALFVLGVGVIIFSLLPVPRVQQVLPMPPITLPTGTPVSWYLPGWGI